MREKNCLEKKKRKKEKCIRAGLETKRTNQTNLCKVSNFFKSILLSLSHTQSLYHTHNLYLSHNLSLSRTISFSLSITRTISFSLSHTQSLSLSHTHTHTHTHTQMCMYKQNVMNVFMQLQNVKGLNKSCAKAKTKKNFLSQTHTHLYNANKAYKKKTTQFSQKNYLTTDQK